MPGSLTSKDQFSKDYYRNKLPFPKPNNKPDLTKEKSNLQAW